MVCVPSSSSVMELANLISQSIPKLQDESPQRANDARGNVIETCSKMLALVTSPAEMLKEMVLIVRSHFLTPSMVV